MSVVTEQMRRACEKALQDDPLAQKLAMFLHKATGQIEPVRRGFDGKLQYKTLDGRLFDDPTDAFVHGSGRIFRAMAKMARKELT